jgi:hypothetical protein
MTKNCAGGAPRRSSPGPYGPPTAA